MISGEKNRHKIIIDITTYKRRYRKIMNEKSTKSNKRVNPKFICSICLNTKHASDNDNARDGKRQTKSCPICQMNCEICKNSSEKTDVKDKKTGHDNVKNVQTSQKQISQGLNLLNEVLTVFQSRKGQESPNHEKAVYRDASVSTDNIKITKPILTVSKIFKYSIEVESEIVNGKFAIITSHQPEKHRRSQGSIELIKHKSSSIPQMKLEELKKSLKEKSQIKDAVKEVHRMFATVNRKDLMQNETNRPVVRNGPRVLPVVKTKNENTERKHCLDIHKETYDRSQCNFSHADFMSRGDYAKCQCCHHHKPCEADRNEKGVYMVCCHNQNYMLHTQNGFFVHERCETERQVTSRECFGNCEDSS